MRGVVCDEWMWCGVEGRPKANRKHQQTRTRKRPSHTLCALHNTPRERNHGIWAWASNQSHEHSNGQNNRMQKQPDTERQPTRKQETYRPAQHTAHTQHTHTHNGQARAARWGGRALGFRGVHRIKRSRGARARHSREQRGEVRHGGLGKDVATCWQQCCSQKMLWACCAEDYQPQPPLCKTCS